MAECGKRNYLVFLRSEAEPQTESYCYVEVGEGEGASTYCLSNEPLGQRKKALLQTVCWGQTMDTLTHQVFYYPEEVLVATDSGAQRIKILRPIDVFYSLFQAYSQNFTAFLQAARKFIPEAALEDLIAFCWQMLADPEGIYFSSREFSLKGRELSGEGMIVR